MDQMQSMLYMVVGLSLAGQFQGGGGAEKVMLKAE